MDNIYLEMDYVPRHETSGHHVRRWRFVIIPLCVLAIIIGWYSLTFIPMFDIQTISIHIEKYSVVPAEVQRVVSQLRGASIFSFEISRVEKQLNALSIVSQTDIRRKFPSGIMVNVKLTQPDAIIAAIDQTDTIEHMFMVDDNHITLINYEDYLPYKEEVSVVQVSSGYAKYLALYGIDQGLQNVVRIAKSMGESTTGSYNLITKIKYDNNNSNGFGNMVLDMPSLNAKLYIRESVSESRLAEAIRLITYEHERDTMRNIALNGELRYDLYNNSLVTRR